MPEINLFDGGINRHKDSRKLSPNEFISVLDGEISSGSLVSLSSPIYKQSNVSPVFVEYKDKVVSGSGEYLKFAKSLNYLFKCNGEKPQYTLGKTDLNGDLEWLDLGITPVNALVTVKLLKATMASEVLSTKGTSELGTYHYAILLDEGMSTERVYMMDFDCLEPLKVLRAYPSTIDKPYNTLSIYRKYGSVYYLIEGTTSSTLDFVSGGNMEKSYPTIVDAQFTYSPPVCTYTGTRPGYYGLFFRTDGTGRGRLWAIGQDWTNLESSYDWHQANVNHYIDEVNFKSGASPSKGDEFFIYGNLNTWLVMVIEFIGKESTRDGAYSFTFDVYHIYGSYELGKLFMYRIKFGYNYIKVIRIEDIEADKVNTSISPVYRKTEATTYRDAQYQEFTKDITIGGLRSPSSTMNLEHPLTATGLAGDYQYALTYIDDGGQETAAGEYSAAVSSDGASLEVTIPTIPDLDPTVSKINLYRMDTSIYGGQTTFLLVKQFDVASLPVVYIDNTQTSSLGGEMPAATVTPVADDLLFLTSYKGRLFAATKDYFFDDATYTPTGSGPTEYPPEPHLYGNIWTANNSHTYLTGDLIGQTIDNGGQVLYTDNKWEIFNNGVNRYDDYLTIRWSELGKPLVWLGNSWLNMDAPITGIGTSGNGLLIFSLTETFSLMGTESEPFTHRLISGSQGCVDFRSIKEWNGSCVYASIEGICISDGGIVELISYPKLGIYNMLASLGGRSYKSVADSELMGSSLVGNTYFLLFKSGTILKVDLLNGIFTEMNSPMLGLGMYNGQLHGVDKARNLNLMPYQVGGDKYYSITTGLITEGAITNLKEYDKVRVNIGGTATIDILIDGKIVIKNYTLSNGVTMVGIPNEKNKGYAIQFTIGGIGSLHSIEYTLRGRDNE